MKKQTFLLCIVVGLILALFVVFKLITKESLTLPPTPDAFGFVNQTGIITPFYITSFPIGSIVLFPINTEIPNGWVVCDGTTQYTGNNGQTLNVPNLTGSSSSIFCQIVAAAGYTFILKTLNNSQSSTFALLKNADGFSTTQIDTTPQGVVTLYCGSNLFNSWNNLGSLSKYYSSILPPAITETTQLQNFISSTPLQSTLQSLELTLSALPTDSSSLATSMDAWVAKQFYQGQIDALNGAYANINAANTQANTALTNDLSNLKTALKPLSFISKVEDNSPGLVPAVSQIVLNADGNRNLLSPIPVGTLILWNDADSPPSNIWVKCDSDNIGDNTVYGTEYSYSSPALNTYKDVSYVNNWTSTSYRTGSPQQISTPGYAFTYSIVPPGVSFYTKIYY